MKEELRIEQAGGGSRTAVVRVHGDLDSRGAPVLVARCHEFALEGRNLVLNLNGVSFLSSSGIGALLALAEEFRQRGRCVRLAALSPAAESVIRLLNLDQFLRIDDSEQAALEANEAA